jgi:hypothetical protein
MNSRHSFQPWIWRQHVLYKLWCANIRRPNNLEDQTNLTSPWKIQILQEITLLKCSSWLQWHAHILSVSDVFATHCMLIEITSVFCRCCYVEVGDIIYTVLTLAVPLAGSLEVHKQTSKPIIFVQCIVVTESRWTYFVLQHMSQAWCVRTTQLSYSAHGTEINWCNSTLLLYVTGAYRHG